MCPFNEGTGVLDPGGAAFGKYVWAKSAMILCNNKY